MGPGLLAATPATPNQILKGCERQGVIVYSRDCLLPGASAMPPVPVHRVPVAKVPASAAQAPMASTDPQIATPSPCAQPVLDQAAYGGDLTRLRHCAPGPDRLATPTASDPGRGRTPLHWAVAGGQAAAVTYLLDAGSPLGVGARADRGAQPLHLTADRGDLALARLLLEAGAPLEGRDLFGYTPLHRGAVAGQGAMVRQLLKQGARVDARDRTGKTPLMLAARQGHSKALTALLAAGADPDATSRGGMTALHYAQGNAAIVEELLAAGASPPASSQPLRSLIEAGIDGNWAQIEQRLASVPQTQLNKALALSVDQGHLPLFRLLLQRGADPGELRLARFQGQPQLLRVVLEQQLRRADPPQAETVKLPGALDHNDDRS